jgi:hypothetical protein
MKILPLKKDRINLMGAVNNRRSCPKSIMGRKMRTEVERRDYSALGVLRESSLSLKASMHV